MNPLFLLGVGYVAWYWDKTQTPSTTIITDPNDPSLSVLEFGSKAVREWREYEVVGTNAEGTEVIIQGEWLIEDKGKEIESYKVSQNGNEVDAYKLVDVEIQEIAPTPEEWKFRVALRNQAGVITPTSGKSKGYAMQLYGNTESTQAINPNQWGVPLDEATLAANAKLQIGTKPPQGGFDKPDVTVKEDSTELVQDKVNLTIDERSFPDPSSGSFEGFAVSNNLGGDVIDFV